MISNQSLRDHAFALLIIPALVLFAACAVNGPRFRPAESSPPDSALVYLYWPKQDAPTHFSIMINGTPVMINGMQVKRFRTGQYVPIVAPTGVVTLTSRVQFKVGVTRQVDVAVAKAREVTFETTAGGVSYVRCESGYLSFPFLVRNQELEMTCVPSAKGKAEIVKCRLPKLTKSNRSNSGGEEGN